MCNGSKAAQAKNDTKVGDTLGISTVGLHDGAGQPAGKIGAFHAPGQTTAECVQCVLTGQKLTLSRISPAIQAAHSLPATAVATFVQGLNWHNHDVLVFDVKRPAIKLIDLADQGIEVYVGERKPDIKGAVDAVIANATAGAAQAAKDDGKDGGTSLGKRPRTTRARPTVMACLAFLALMVLAALPY
ncbi:MAG: hypothetical protein V4474_00515 [Patescibacteria group bacterium]